MNEAELARLEHDITTAIEDSVGVNWTPYAGAVAVMAMLESQGYQIKPPAITPGDQVWSDGSDELWTVIHIHEDGAWLQHTTPDGFTYDQVHHTSEIHLKDLTA